jgi:hypothetical protein
MKNTINKQAKSGLKFIDEGRPENLVESIQSSYLSLCTSHQLGASHLSDISKILAIIVRCETSFTAQNCVTIEEEGLRNAIFLMSLLGLSGSLKLWKTIDWISLARQVRDQGDSAFIKVVLDGIEIEKYEGLKVSHVKNRISAG